MIERKAFCILALEVLDDWIEDHALEGIQSDMQVELMHNIYDTVLEIYNEK